MEVVHLNNKIKKTELSFEVTSKLTDATIPIHI